MPSAALARHLRVAEMARPSLYVDLAAYYPLQEPSGIGINTSGYGVTLVDNNTVTQAAGPSPRIPFARQYTAANSEYHSRGDDAFVSIGDIPMTLTAWALLTSKPGQMAIVSKFGAAGQRAYNLFYNSASDVFSGWISGDGTAFSAVDATAFGSPALNTWHFLTLEHDPVANTFSISVNRQAPTSIAWTTGIFDNTAAFEIGRRPSTDYWNGLVAGVGLWKRLLTRTELDWLYNDGRGRLLIRRGIGQT